MTLDEIIPYEFRERIESEIYACDPIRHEIWLDRRSQAQEIWTQAVENELYDEFTNHRNLLKSVKGQNHSIDDMIRQTRDSAAEHSYCKRLRDAAVKVLQIS